VESGEEVGVCDLGIVKMMGVFGWKLREEGGVSREGVDEWVWEGGEEGVESVGEGWEERDCGCGRVECLGERFRSWWWDWPEKVWGVYGWDEEVYVDGVRGVGSEKEEGGRDG
jgi:hypothetical protein